MTIGQRKGPVGPPNEAPAGAHGEAVAPRAATHGGDRAAVSEDPGELARLRAEVGPVDAVRADVVRALRTAVESGRYAPDPVAVATSFLRDLLGELLA
jgi:hypothetical protein